MTFESHNPVAIANVTTVGFQSVGIAVFIVMNFVVLPHTAVVKSPLSLPLLLNGVLAHALFVGLPIALAARRITNQSSRQRPGFL
jgi:hypothetical protein